MRWLWTALAAVVMAGVAALWWPETVERAQATTFGAGHERAATVPTAESRTAEASTATAAAFTPERQADGTLRLDARFSISGSGSEQDPFRVTWPLLASASDTIDAAAGRLTPPPHIGFLAGQWVQISAYLAPPLWGESTSELLVMKNRWDGCCIGLPPTPFDCIEATLATPVTLGARHSISYGTVRGRLVVQPFTAGAFLLGLYRLEQAQLEDMKAR